MCSAIAFRIAVSGTRSASPVKGAGGEAGAGDAGTATGAWGAPSSAGARWAARHGVTAIGVDPAGAPCIAESLAAGRPVTVETTGTSMAGLDAGTPSAAAWPTLADGLAGAIVVGDAEADHAMRDLAATGIEAGESGAAGLAGLRALVEDEACAALRVTARRGDIRSALVVVTEGATDPERYAQVISA